MKQGEVWLADLKPTRGSEQSGRRPVVIISGDTLNENLPIVIVVPVTSRVKRYPTCVRIAAGSKTGLSQASEAIPFQIRAVAKVRLIKRMGSVSSSDLRSILRGLLAVLSH